MQLRGEEFCLFDDVSLGRGDVTDIHFKFPNLIRLAHECRNLCKQRQELVSGTGTSMGLVCVVAGFSLGDDVSCHDGMLTTLGSLPGSPKRFCCNETPLGG